MSKGGERSAFFGALVDGWVGDESGEVTDVVAVGGGFGLAESEQAAAINATVTSAAARRTDARDPARQIERRGMATN
jgi:hypothetical protein